MTNPSKAIDAILDDEKDIGGAVVKPLTIARYALLERTDSPILTGKEQHLEDVITTLYIMTADVKDLIGKDNDELKRDAFIWADDLEATAVQNISKQIISQLATISYVSPDGKDEGDKKKE